jgi:precorrin-2 dehydrogenase / sirohydrochlorin ferrochelatase
MPTLYPLFLKLKGKKCLVVGGGKVAERKVLSLLETEATVTVVSPQLTPVLTELKEQFRITHIEQEYQVEVLDGIFLAISATDAEEVNLRVAEDCFSRNILINVVDDPEKCNFFVPAVVRRGHLSIAVSTDGKCPLLAARIRADLEKTFGPEYADLLELLEQVRTDLIKNEPSPEKRREILEKLLQSDFLELFREKRLAEIEERVLNVYRSSRS